VASVGPGAIVSVALIAPVAMAIGQRAGLPPFLTALMVANGANAGNLSPVSAVGIIANDRMMAAGIGGHEWKVFAANFLAHAAVGALAYGLLIRQSRPSSADVDARPGRLTAAQWLTVAVVAGWILAVTGFGAPIGLSAFAAAAAVVVLRAADETRSIKAMPWAAIVMVSGMTMLVTLVERTGGLEVFTGLLARLASPSTINGVIALVTGLISTYSSTSAVVLPTFLPTVPGLVRQVGGGDPLAVALSINVGASPLHAGRPLRRGAPGRRRREGPVPQADDLGTVDERRRRAAVSTARVAVRAALACRVRLSVPARRSSAGCAPWSRAS
jgi:di/tricarboxylate transporter